MESALTPVPKLDRFVFEIQQIDSLSIIEPRNRIPSDILIPQIPQLISQCISPNLFELTPLHETKYKESYLSYSSYSSNNQEQEWEQYKMGNVLAPSIENIVLEHQKNEQIKEFNERCRLNVKKIFSLHKQCTSKQFDSDFSEKQNGLKDLKITSLKQMCLSYCSNDSHNTTPPTTPEHQKNSLHKQADERLDLMYKTEVETLQKMKQHNKKLEKVLTFLNDCGKLGRINEGADKGNVDKNVLRECMSRYWLSPR